VGFKLGREQEYAFSLLKEKIISALLLLSLLDFTKKFEIECDALEIGNKTILM
jgi:hypothetical protein